MNVAAGMLEVGPEQVAGCNDIDRCFDFLLRRISAIRIPVSSSSTRCRARGDENRLSLLLRLPLLRLSCFIVHLFHVPSRISPPCHRRDQTTLRQTMAELKKPSWDNAEIAFILNWSDYCIRCGGNYKTDILTELYRLPRADDFSPIQRTWAAVSSKLYQLLRCINNITPATLFRDGTSCLDVQKIPDNILREMNKQRAEWEFELLEKEEVNVPVVLGDVLMGEFVVSVLYLHLRLSG